MARNAAVLFGRIAVERGHLTAEQLEALLQEQSQAGQGAQTVLLGDLCVQKGLLTQNQVRRILESQRDGGEGETTTLGALAVRNGFATTQEVELALDAQKHPEGGEGRPPAKLGEILLAMGTLTSQKHKALLLAQSRLRDDDLDASGELELETREISLADAPPAAPPEEAVAWLIQESGEGTGQLFRLGTSATIGRMPAHDVPVADMGASREHATIEFSAVSRQHVLKDLDSRNGTFINGVRVDQLTPLQTGDLIRIGETDLRYAAAALPPRGKADAPVDSGPSRIARILRALRELHAQRKGFLLASLAGLVSPFLPWTRVAGQASTLGIRTAPGLLALLLFAAGAALSLLRDRAKPLDRPFLLGLLGATSLAALLAIAKLIALAFDPAAGAGLGVPLAILAGLSVPVALWFTRAPIPPPVTWGGKPAPPPEAPAPPAGGVWARIRGTAARAGEPTVRVLRGLSGRKARERARAADRRDELLVALGRAALEAGVTGPEADSARKAQEALEAAKDRFEKVGKETSARDLLIAKSDLKWAEARLERALRKLGRLAVDRAVPLEGRQAEVAEVQSLDVQLKEEP